MVITPLEPVNPLMQEEVTIIAEGEVEPQPTVTDNLAEQLDEETLDDIASELIDAFDADVRSRKDYEDTIKKGMELLGLKIEDRYCLVDADNIAAVSGISFAEWGPGDMGMSFGHLDQHDPPYSDEMNDAREIVKNAIDKSGLAFLCGWKDSSMNEEQQTRFCLDELGARILHVSDSNLANEIRIEMGREMPW